MAMTLRARFVTSNVTLCAFTLALAVVLCHNWLGMALQRHHDHQLQESAERIIERIDNKSLERGPVAEAVHSSGVESTMTMVLVRNGQELIYNSSVLHRSDDALGHNDALAEAATLSTPLARFLTLTLDESELARFVSIPIKQTGGVVQVGVALGDVAAWLHSVEFWAAILVPVLLVVTSVGSWLLADRVLRPTRLSV